VKCGKTPGVQKENNRFRLSRNSGDRDHCCHHKNYREDDEKSPRPKSGDNKEPNENGANEKDGNGKPNLMTGFEKKRQLPTIKEDSKVKKKREKKW